MPIIKAGEKLVFYAHVPKCGGSAVGHYLARRFGSIAFADTWYTRHPPHTLWSRTSPQHIDLKSLRRLFPVDFFDACFTIVRHPVSRIVSAYHFQLEVEQSISSDVSFSEWLRDLPDRLSENPFLYDNHVRPMAEIAPLSAQVFHMEHGLDALVPWFDVLTGQKTGPRAVAHVNVRGTHVRTGRAEPSRSDLDFIGSFYAQDFERFGYQTGQKAPSAPAPVLSPEILAERDAELAAERRGVKSQLKKLKHYLSK